VTASDPAAEAADIAIGVFAGPVAGLRYQTPTKTGVTNERGEFQYRKGESVTFLVGGLVLGSVEGAPRVNLAQLVNRADGKIDRLHDPIVTNLARLIQTLDEDGSVENGVTIAAIVHDLIEPMVINFNQADTDAAKAADGAASSGPSSEQMVSFAGDQTVTFARDPMVTELLRKLNATPGVFTANKPRRLRDAAAARNELRRNIRGIVKLTDVQIPLRDGSYVCADVFRPADDGQYPVVMNQGFYGKSFDHGCICSEQDAAQKEELEDRFFTGNPDGLQYENHESVDSSVWVPNGYVCIRVDARGVGQSPGLQAPFSVQQAEDYYDAIEWAGTQPWSNGNVGLWGMSYLAITQHTVASLQPPHLKAMIALGTDADLYNEALYGGGLYGEGFWTWWRKAMAGHNFCGERRWRVDLHASRDREGHGAGMDRRPADRRCDPPAGQQRDLHPVDGCAGEEIRLRRRVVSAQLPGVDDRRAHAVLRPLAQGSRQRRDGRCAGPGAGAHRQWRPLHIGRGRMAHCADHVPALVPRRRPVGLDGRRSPGRLPAHQRERAGRRGLGAL
jgi:uncharacterized protein